MGAVVALVGGALVIGLLLWVIGFLGPLFWIPLLLIGGLALVGYLWALGANLIDRMLRAASGKRRAGESDHPPAE